MENNRIEWVDALKGIGIIFVILGHTHVIFRNYIFSFHMPLFFFISGYLFCFEKYGVREFVIKKIRTLIIPYVFFCFLSIIITFLVYNKECDIVITLKEIILSTRNNIPINSVLWFFTCLFVVEVLFYELSKLLRNNYIKTVIIIILSIIGFLKLSKPSFVFSSDIALYYLLFYFLGNSLKRVKELKNQNIFKIISSLCLLVATFFMVSPSKYSIITKLFSNSFYINYLYSIAIAIIGILSCIRLSFILEKLKILTRSGKNSLIIFPLHIFFISGVYYFLHSSLGLTVNQGYNIYNVVLTTTCILIFIPIANFMNNYFPEYLGRY